MKLSIIIPAYNEERRLAGTLEHYCAVLDEQLGEQYELIVVANGCRDNTAGVALEVAERHPQVRLVDIAAAIGKGGAVLAGFREAHGRQVVFADADGATEPRSLLQLLDSLGDSDIAIGSRRMPESAITRRQPLQRRVFSRLFNASIRLLFDLPYADTQCGAKAFRRDAAWQLASVVNETRWAFDVDLLLCARQLGLNVSEQAVTWEDKDGSKLRVSSTIREVLSSFWRMKRRHTAAPAGALQSMIREA